MAIRAAIPAASVTVSNSEVTAVQAVNTRFNSTFCLSFNFCKQWFSQALSLPLNRLNVGDGEQPKVGLLLDLRFPIRQVNNHCARPLQIRISDPRPMPMEVTDV